MSRAGDGRDESGDNVVFSFREDTECDTHEMLDCQCGGRGEREHSSDDEEEREEREERGCQLGRQEEVRQEDQLADWSHVAAPLEETVQDSVLGLASQFVSFVMLKSFHSEI